MDAPATDLLADITSLGNATIAARIDGVGPPMEGGAEALRHAIDEIVAEGKFHFVNAGSPVGIGLKVEEVRARVADIAGCLGDDADLTNRVWDVTRINVDIFMTIAAVMRSGEVEPRGPSSDVTNGDPTAWLSDWPVELAELRLAAERGVVAAAMLASAATMRDRLSLEHANELLDLWRGGSIAVLRLLATFWPAHVSLELVPDNFRVDLTKAREGQSRWKQFVEQKLHGQGQA